MTIRNKLRINLTLTVLLIFVITAGEYTQYRLLQKHQEQFNTVIHFSEIAYDLNFLTYDYLQELSERTREQWFLQHEKLLNDIEELIEKETENSGYVAAALNDATTAKKIFQKITEIDQNPSSQDKPQLKSELKKRLTAQLLVSSRGLYANALQLVNLSEKNALENQKKESAFVLVIFLVFSSILVGITYLVVNSISPSLNRLKKVFERVAQGNLTTRSHIESKDEFGDISKNFDHMLDKLDEITVSRDNLSAEIAERKKIESQLSQFKLILDKTLDSVFMFTPDPFKFFYVNQGAIDQVGYSQEELLEMTPLDIKPNFSKEEFLQLLKPLLTGSNLSKTFETVHRHKNGTLIPVEIFLQHITLPDGRACFVAIVRDISTRIEIEIELRQAHKMEAIGTLAGGIAHDFNNILTAIISYAEFAKEDLPEDSSAGEDIDIIIKSSRRAADLVQQILTFSRKSEHNLQSLNPHLLVKEALRMLQSSLPSTIIIHEDIDKGCGKIWADPTNIHQIMMNLCTNALHAMEKEKGTLTVKLYRREVAAEEIEYESGVSAGPFIVLSISDTGHGMDEVTKKRIFDPFFTTKETGKGTGMGLAVIHGIIQVYKGFIKVDSTPGEGSTFSVYIPALQEEATSPGDFASKESGNEEPLPTGNERILVVDDEPILVRTHKRQLTRLGYRVTVTTDSKDALEKFRTHPEDFDLLITDQTMPGLSGVELAAAVHKIKPDMPTILCTGHSDVVSEEDALAMGVKKYVPKPICRDELSQAIREVLDEKYH